MRLTAICLLGIALSVSARTLSQTVTFSGRHVPLEKAFAAIKQQTGYLVLYSVDVISQANPVSITARNEPLTAFLSRLLQDQPLSFVIENKTISIQRSVMPPSPPVRETAQAPPPITGIVRGPDGRPLTGVNIVI
ncbi:MAG: STN domain-containing protein, partial [Chitinophaga rupis]